MSDRSQSLGPRSGSCYWCGDPADSLEDIIPQWIDKVLVVPADLSVGMKRLHSTSGGQRRTKPVQRWATKLIGTRSVCEPCNNGWMSVLEQTTRPLLEPMILGHRAFLSVTDQIQIARWATMKAAVADSRPDTPVEGLASEAIRAAIYERGEPPIDMKVRLAAFDEPFTVMFSMPHGTGTGKAGQYLAQWCTSFVFGHLVVQIAARTGTTKPGVLEQLPRGEHDGRTFTVWPPMPSGVEWPPRIVLDRRQLAVCLTEQVPGHEPADDLFDLPETCRQCGENHGILTRRLPTPAGAGPAEGLVWLGAPACGT